MIPRRLLAGLGGCRHASSSTSASAHYDLVVIGGGSGGLACSKEAASFGKKVAVLDYVQPSSQGSTWGLGGTCVNVGCIPKKLMHQAALAGTLIKKSSKLGWNVPDDVSHDWSTLCGNVNNYIRSLNWGYRVQLKDKAIDYINAYGTFSDAHTVRAVDKRQNERRITADHFVVAVGGRPQYPDIDGTELGITSDDIFTLQSPPGKTLVVGASYVALECAGFLTGLGYDTSVMVRSICLRGFDQSISSLVAAHMEHEGTRFLRNSSPTKLQRHGENEILVTWQAVADNSSVVEHTEVFNTVLFATGRTASTKSLGLESIGVQADTHTGKLIGSAECPEQTSVPHISAIGDVLQGCPELTPVAIRSGKLLARRLFAGSSEQMNYDLVPTTVFTPLEYGCVGLSEEDAIQRHGESDIEVFHANYRPLEYAITDIDHSSCYTKLVCVKENKQHRIVGFHFVGPNAGEVTQGFAVSMSAGITYEQLSSCVGIHPTCAEEIVKLHITKRSGEDASVSGC
ncbi:thioredoxin reductase 2, mitochondrial-like [Sycon ciliatum]|uniref:thioredoxin reductase 2, mitochondrial-like n=1 Tax=Sycon ciliatum TaxID=27933 RepID=UPI0031F655EE